MRARPIDANKLLRVLNSNFGHTGGAAVMKQLIEAQSTLTQPNNWISVKDRLPEEHKVVLCIVNGKPETNITLRNAYQLGSWNKTEGWIIEEYPVWEDAVVSWWQPLPEPPEED